MFSRRCSRSSRAPRAARLTLEPLEDRSLPSATPLGVPQLLITTTSGEVQKVRVADGASVEQALAAYRGRADVVVAELDQRVHVSVLPNDSRFSTQWSLR